MKFRNPITGAVFENIFAAKDAYCTMDCENCIFECDKAVREAPKKAARLMGYVIEEENMSEKKDKPRICTVLGVEVGERFKFECGGYCNEYFVSETGALNWAFDRPVDAYTILMMINHPEHIIRTPLTDNEQAICKVLGVKYVSTGRAGKLITLWNKKPTLDNDGGYAVCPENDRAFIGTVTSNLFPSVQPGDLICTD